MGGLSKQNEQRLKTGARRGAMGSMGHDNTQSTVTIIITALNFPGLIDYNGFY